MGELGFKMEDKIIKNWALNTDELNILNKCLRKIYRDGKNKDIKNGDIIKFKEIKIKSEVQKKY